MMRHYRFVLPGTRCEWFIPATSAEQARAALGTTRGAGPDVARKARLVSLHARRPGVNW